MVKTFIIYLVDQLVRVPACGFLLFPLRDLLGQLDRTVRIVQLRIRMGYERPGQIVSHLTITRTDEFDGAFDIANVRIGAGAQ